ncbi:hypothetical protein ACFO3J_16480 [Streptomyces polygonati]|uniref:Resolvase/invertase-type recombinase catalytic domain-containing protein n=2 Tax=Streptomyces polygonati TaxID=1617087 RepID=A0ABV8HQE3_9ACTN
MRAYDVTPDVEVMREELHLFRWAQARGYDLVAVYQEVEEGSIDVLTELVEELRRTGSRAVLVPSIEHFGTSHPLQDNLWAHVVHNARAEVHEVNQ